MTEARLHARAPGAAAARAAVILDNIRSGMGSLVRPPKPPRQPAAPFMPAWRRLRLEAAPAVIGTLAFAMFFFDSPLHQGAAALPGWVKGVAAVVTDFGRSGWILVPAGAPLLLMALLASPALDYASRAVLAMVAVRLGFVFVGVGLPGLIVTIVKRWIGRVRPSHAGPFAYEPFSWRPDYASFPSGHTTTAFAALVAIGAICPRLRPALWIYAVAIGASRVIVSAHFASDVIAAAAFGAFGALAVRDWFAMRRLGFYVGSDGAVHAMAGPSPDRIKRVAAGLFARLKPVWTLLRAGGRRQIAMIVASWPRSLSIPPGKQDMGGGLRVFSSCPDRTLAMANDAHQENLLLAAEDRQPAPTAGIPRVSVVVPVRNEAGNIAPLVAEITQALAAFAPSEIIYVNDGSQDETEAELKSLMEAHAFLRQIRHDASSGQSAAVRSGVRAARAPLVATLDGDGQNDPAFLPALISVLERDPGVGLVAGQRVGRKDTGFKRLQSRIANRVRNAVLRDGTRDTGCGLKAFRRDVFLALPYFDGLHRFLPALVRREGFGVAYVDVVDRPRLSGVSNYGLFDRLWVGILDLAGVWWLIRRRKRVPQVSEVVRDAG